MAATRNIGIDQYATFTIGIGYKDAQGDPVNLTGYSAAMQVRDSAGELLLSLSTTPTANGSVLTVTPLAGTIDVLITDEDSATLTNGVYDLVITNGSGTKTRLIEGKVTVNPGVTHG